MHECRSSPLSGAPVISARLRPIVGILEGDTARTVNASLTFQRELAHFHKISPRESAAACDATVPRGRPIFSMWQERFVMVAMRNVENFFVCADCVPVGKY